MEENKITVQTEERGFPFFSILYRHLLLIIAIIILCTGVGVALAYTTSKPVYTAKCNVMLKVYTKTSGSGVVSSSTSFAKRYLPTIADAIKSPAVIELAQLLDDGDKGIRSSSVSVSRYNDSLIMGVSYRDSIGQRAVDRLEKIIYAAGKSFEVEPPISVEGIELVIMQNSITPTRSSNFNAYIIIAVVVGIVLGVLTAMLIYIFDNNVKDEREIEALTGVSVLAYLQE